MRPTTSLCLATLWLVSLEGVSSGGLPRVWWQPGSAVEKGDTVQLQCQVASEGAGPAIWLKLDPRDPNSHVLLSHGDLIITEDPRFSVLHIQETNIYVVKIREVSAADAGSYQCQVPVSDEEEELRVEAAPPVVITLQREEGSGSPAGISSNTCLLAALCFLATLVR
ncbi:lachesin [Procambarus clarkii]|uniref:lachesin n=1 Tax=Procambarus clarkii TaxID=6728 RepID=UPI001E67574A|nr:lachesin-like [Procambarus clarkii]XP_045583883.1 lachesin-like [Procambarus clarkii]XP_045583884.1 lachesin-like [Procambarus clarkii]